MELKKIRDKWRILKFFASCHEEKRLRGDREARGYSRGVESSITFDQRSSSKNFHEERGIN